MDFLDLAFFHGNRNGPPLETSSEILAPIIIPGFPHLPAIDVMENGIGAGGSEDFEKLNGTTLVPQTCHPS
jgi:hypothetical protein